MCTSTVAENADSGHADTGSADTGSADARTADTDADTDAEHAGLFADDGRRGGTAGGQGCLYVW